MQPTAPLDARVAGHHDHLDLEGVPHHAVQELEAARAVQEQVHQDHVERRVVELRAGLRQPGRESHLVALRPEDAFEGLQQQRLVVHQQDDAASALRAHRALARRRQGPHGRAIGAAKTALEARAAVASSPTPA
jgi:hypothetical protein